MSYRFKKILKTNQLALQFNPASIVINLKTGRIDKLGLVGGLCDMLYSSIRC